MFIRRDRILIPVGTSTAAWMDRWGLEKFEVPCSQCGTTRELTIPFAQGDYRGLIAPVCQCGTEDRPYCFVRANGDDVLAYGR